MQLTTNEIIEYIEKDIVPLDWPWESAIESACESPADAADGARFLEKLEPGRSWSAEEYHGLMYHHFTGRWGSAAHLGHIRANERYEDLAEKYAKDPDNLARVTADRDRRVASDEAAEKWVRGQEHAGSYVFDSANGTVLTFDRIFGGIMHTEDPA